MPKQYDPKEFIYNSETKRWVKRDGPSGKILVRQEAERAERTKENIDKESIIDNFEKLTIIENDVDMTDMNNISEKNTNTNSGYVYRTLRDMVDKGTLFEYKDNRDPNTIYSFIKRPKHYDLLSEPKFVI